MSKLLGREVEYFSDQNGDKKYFKGIIYDSVISDIHGLPLTCYLVEETFVKGSDGRWIDRVGFNEIKLIKPPQIIKFLGLKIS